jgi:cell division protein FtsQ
MSIVQLDRYQALSGRPVRVAARTNRRPGETRRRLLRAGAWTGGMAFTVLLLAAMSLALLVVHRYVTTSSFFAVQEVSLLGNARLGEAEVLRAAGYARGENIFEVEIKEMERRLTDLPWIDRASVRRVLPGRLEIVVVERKPAFWVLRGDRLHYADEEGKAIAPLRHKAFSSLPMLMGGRGAEARRAMAAIAGGELPVSPENASWVDTASGREVRMYFEKDDLLLVLGLDDLQGNAAMAAKAWKDIRRRGESAGVYSMKAMAGRVWVGKR